MFFLLKTGLPPPKIPTGHKNLRLLKKPLIRFDRFNFGIEFFPGCGLILSAYNYHREQHQR